VRKKYKLKAFSLIEISVCLIIIGALMSMIFSTSTLVQKRLHEQKVIEALKTAEASLVGYYYKYQHFPHPEGKVVLDHGVLRGEFPTSKLGPLPVKIEYHVDHRTIQQETTSLHALKENRLGYLAPSEFMVPYVVKYKDQMVYMTNIAFIARYFPYKMCEIVEDRNPRGIPAFQK